MPETGSFDPQGIIAGAHALTHKPLTVLSGEGALVRGAVMGQVTLGAVSSAAKAGGNTGTGTFVLDATTPKLANAIAGVYTLRCVAAVTNGGTFELKDPKGRSLGRYDITGGAGGTVAVSDQIKGVLTDGATDFAVGDGFDITIAAGSNKWRLSTTAALDGSATPKAILAGDVDATAADAQGEGYLEGEFAQEMLTYGTGHSATTVEQSFRDTATPIYLRSVGVNA